MQNSTLKDLILKKSYREGEFTLSSGQKSTYYVDLKPTALDAEGSALIGAACVEKICNEVADPGTIAGVGGLTLGADPLATAVSMKSLESGHAWPAFIVRKEPKAHGTSRYIEGIENLKEGGNLVVLEDVTSTGASSLKAVHRVKEHGFNVAGVLTIVDREMGAQAKYEAEGVPFWSLFLVSEFRS